MDETFDADCDWPRRLLHVNSLTSYEWQPGGIYGEHTKPKYNIISYTWGRFMLREGEYPDVQSMPIKGTTWENDLPRIKPEAFTVKELLNIINIAAQPYKQYPAVDFVWLDIACIDQTPGSPSNASEVGRQARIFRGACDSFIWLTRHNARDILRWKEQINALVTDLRPFDQEATPSQDTISWLNNASRLLTEFACDPWFASLWTLQESFLRPRSILLPRDGLTTHFLDSHRNRDGNTEFFTLKAWVDIWNLIKWEAERVPSICKTAAFEVLNSLRETGFLEGNKTQLLTFTWDDLGTPPRYMGNPFNLLIASKARKTTRETDRIYAIMQVWDLKLGKAAPQQHTTEFSLPELKHQLAATLLQKHPIFSQLMIQPADWPPREAWMMHDSVSLPLESFQIWNHVASGGKMDIKTSMGIRKICGTLVACFTGLATPFTDWHDALMDDGSRWNVRLGLDGWLEEEMGHAGTPRHSLKASLRWLHEEFGELRILLLGRVYEPEIIPRQHRICDWAIGLLIDPEVGDGDCLYFKRLGFIIWDLDLMSAHHLQELGYLSGEGTGWDVVQDGFFG